MYEQILAVMRMQDYINMHLYEKITPADLADAALFSPWHARRIFLKYTGMSPADYIRRLRLGRSALRLRDENHRILDIALQAGFGSVDGYQRAFAREFGCNPKEYAKNPVTDYTFPPYGVKSCYHERRKKEMEKSRNIFIQVVDKPKRKVIIKRGIHARNYLEYCQEVDCDLWDQLIKMDSLGNEPVSLWLPKAYIKPGTSEYVQGVEIPADDMRAIPEGFDVIELPAASYLRFQGEPFPEENYNEAVEEIWNAEKKFNPISIGYQWDKENPRIQFAPIGTRGYFELVPIKKICENGCR